MSGKFKIILGLILVVVVVMSGISYGDDLSVLKCTSTATPESLDPAVGSGENDDKIYVNIYETLVVPDDGGNPQPLIANEWQVSEDGKTWTFKLREDVNFSNGDKLTAEDVKYSMDRMIEIGEGYAFIYKGRIDGVKVVDNYTVEFLLNEPFGPFISTMYSFRIINKELVEANTLEEGNYGENGDYGKEFLLNNSAGSGPYVVDEFKLRKSVVLSKNDNYWREIAENAPDKVKIERVREPSTTKMLVANGDVDLVHGHQSDTTLQQLIKNEGIEYGEMPELGLDYFMMNTKKPPTDDVHIRKAISYATDYEQMSEIYGGMPKASGPVPPTLWGASNNFEQYKYNLEKAKEEIKLSKYSNNLQDYPLEIASIEGNGDTGILAMILAQSLDSLGFNVIVNEVPWVLFCNNEAEIETSPNITNAFCTANYPEAGAILEFKYASWTTGNWNQNEWLQDDKFDNMIKDALTTIDSEERKEKYAEIQKYLVEDVVPSIYTFVSVLKPVYNVNSFSWRVSKNNPHPIIAYNYYFADFEMK